MSKLLLVAFSASEAPLGVGFAEALGFPFDILCFGEAPSADLGAELIKVVAITELPPADAIARIIAGQANGYTTLASASSMHAKDAMARVAGVLDAAMVTDVVEVVSPTEFKRPIVAGSVLATVEVLASPLVATFRPSAFRSTERSGNSPVETLTVDLTSKVERISHSKRGGARPDLSQARVVVSGGRPLKDASTFETIIGGLADALGGAAGATRAAVDSGIAANELQVGQTGKIVAPNLYIAAGISGSTQHMAGIKDSKIIVAINKDADAPIFEFADYGIVADLFDAVPELTRLVKS